MSYFNISSGEMSEPPAKQGWSDAIERYLFGYSGRQHVHVHHSTLNNAALFYFRLCSFVFLTAIYIWTIAALQKSLFENIMYLTMLGYFLSWLYFGLAIQDYLLNYGPHPIAKKLPYFIEIFHEIAICIELPITVVFWGVLFKLVLNAPGVTEQEIILNGFLHSSPFVLMTVDYILNPFCFPPNHLPVVLLFDLAYMVVNMVYSLTVKPIYGPIDWITANSYLIVAGSFVLCFLVHWLCRVFHKKWKIKKLAAISDQERPLLVPDTQPSQPSQPSQGILNSDL